MAKNTRNTRGRIISAAWELFYEQGYDDTTVEEIIERSATSKGSFYHYFDGKDALLSSLSYLFDEEYARLQQELPAGMDAFERIINHPELRNLPFYLETPNEPEGYREEIDLLKKLYK